MRALRIGLIGEHDEHVTAHLAIPVALRLADEQIGRTVEFDWLATDAMPDARDLGRFDALWCVPASPYLSMDSALCAIRFAREQGVPFLGTRGGFQHAVIEYARHVLGSADAEYAETEPGAERAVISPLACSLVEVSDEVRLVPDSRLADAYGCDTAREGYHCRFGVNPAFADSLTRGPLRATARDASGEVRAVELDEHPFFVCTLFQPERAALRGEVPPLAQALLRAAVMRRSASRHDAQFLPTR